MFSGTKGALPSPYWVCKWLSCLYTTENAQTFISQNAFSPALHYSTQPFTRVNRSFAHISAHLWIATHCEDARQYVVWESCFLNCSQKPPPALIPLPHLSVTPTCSSSSFPLYNSSAGPKSRLLLLQLHPKPHCKEPPNWHRDKKEGVDPSQQPVTATMPRNRATKSGSGNCTLTRERFKALMASPLILFNWKLPCSTGRTHARHAGDWKQLAAGRAHVCQVSSASLN